jgi:hypothetical protein
MDEDFLVLASKEVSQQQGFLVELAPGLWQLGKLE